MMILLTILFLIVELLIGKKVSMDTNLIFTGMYFLSMASIYNTHLLGIKIEKLIFDDGDNLEEEINNGE